MDFNGLYNWWFLGFAAEDNISQYMGGSGWCQRSQIPECCAAWLLVCSVLAKVNEPFAQWGKRRASSKKVAMSVYRFESVWTASCCLSVGRMNCCCWLGMQVNFKGRFTQLLFQLFQLALRQWSHLETGESNNLDKQWPASSFNCEEAILV